MWLLLYPRMVCVCDPCACNWIWTCVCVCYQMLGVSFNLFVECHGKLLVCDAGLGGAGICLLRHNVQVDPFQNILLWKYTMTIRNGSKQNM